MAQTAPRVKVVLLLWQLRSAGHFFRARNTNPMYRTTCFARNVTSSIPLKVRFRSHCTLERSKPLLIRPVPQDHLRRWSSGAVQKSTSWTTLTVLTHLRPAPEERVLVRPLQRSEWERGLTHHWLDLRWWDSGIGCDSHRQTPGANGAGRPKQRNWTSL